MERVNKNDKIEYMDIARERRLHQHRQAMATATNELTMLGCHFQ